MFGFGAEIGISVGRVMSVFFVMMIFAVTAAAAAVAFPVGNVVFSHTVGKIQDGKAADLFPGGGNHGKIIANFVDAAYHFPWVAALSAGDHGKIGMEDLIADQTDAAIHLL